MGSDDMIILFLEETKRIVILCRSGRFFHAVLHLSDESASRWTFLATSRCQASAILSNVTHRSVKVWFGVGADGVVMLVPW